MIDAVIYGLTPIEKIEKLFIALPDTKLSMFKKGKSLNCFKLSALIPGTVMSPDTKNENNEDCK